MATIHLTAMTSGPGPHGPAEICATVRHERIFGEDKAEVPVLWMSIGADSLRIWPAEPEVMERLGYRLLYLARRGSIACEHCGGSGIEPDGD